MLKHTLKSIAVISLISLFSIGITSCKKTTGGGWLPIDDGNGKATFGFQANCNNIEYPEPGSGFFVGQLSGNLQFKDHNLNVKIKGKIDNIPYEGNDNPETGPIIEPGEFTTCEMLAAEDTNTAFVTGTYEPVPKTAGPGGTFSAAMGDGDDFGGCDGFIIFISSGIYDGYVEGACLGGGNITVFDETE